jgi:hypothetical protein
VTSPALLRRSCLARLPNTNSMASMTLDLPLPLGPTTLENDCATEEAGRVDVMLGDENAELWVARGWGFESGDKNGNERCNQQRTQGYPLAGVECRWEVCGGGGGPPLHSMQRAQRYNANARDAN